MNLLDKSLKLPDSWIEVELADIGKIVSGGTPSTKETAYWGGSISWISPADLTGYNSKYISKGNKSITEEGLKNSSATIMPAGSINFSSRAPIGYTVISSCDMTTNQGFKSLVPASGVFNEYVYYYLKGAKQLAESKATGTTFKEISGTAFSKLPIPLAPTNEQHRIVAKIEALFSELDKGIESFKTAREQLKIYRQALLKHAFSGKLTEQWRAENAGKLESAETLLQRIQTERQQRYQEQLQDWEASGKQGSKPKAPKILPPLTAEELAELPELPEGWTWIRPEEICSPEAYSIGIGPFGSNLKVSDYKYSGIPLVFVKNITRSDFLLDLKFIDDKKYNELIAHSVKPLDLLITKMGDPPGDCEIYPETSQIAVLTADCLKFRIWDKFAYRKVYKFCINSNFVKRQLGLITKGVAQKKISVERFKTIFLPFFSIEEQQVLVEELESRLSIADQLDQTITTALQQAEALRQAILKKAFSGQLVPQDPNDEPASVLLDRIRAEQVQCSKRPTNAAKRKKNDY